MIYEKFEKLNDEKHGRIIKSVIGMDRQKFNKLAKAFASAYNRSSRNGSCKVKSSRFPQAGRKAISTPRRKNCSSSSIT